MRATLIKEVELTINGDTFAVSYEEAKALKDSLDFIFLENLTWEPYPYITCSVGGGF